MADVTSIYGNPIKDAVARADIATNTQDISDLKDGLQAVQTEVAATLITDTASGAIASFSDGADGVPVKSLTVDIEPVQSGSGDPSPTNIRPITGHTQAVVTRTGKNVFDINKMVNVTNITISNGVISVYGNSQNSTKKLSELSDLVVGETYTLTANTTGVENMIYLYGAGANVSWVFETQKTITQAMLNALVFFYGGNTTTSQISNFMIRPSSITDATFEPYVADTYTIDLDGTRYGGTLDVGTGVLTVDRQIVDMGTLVWGYNSTYSFIYTPSLSGKKVGSVNVLCENYKTLSTPVSSDSQMGSRENNTVSVGAANVVVFVKDTSFTDAASFKTAMNGVQLVYELATPFEVQLTAEEVTTLKGQNNIWADCGNTEVEYRADTKLYIQKVINS